MSGRISAPDRFRSLLAGAKPVVAPGCHDALGARMVEAAGFDVAYMSGNATSAARIGQPDVGLLTQTEMVENAAGIVGALNIPLVVDGDDGYGAPPNVQRTVRAYAAAGVAGVHIEDQAVPKRCGAMGAVKLVSLGEARDRLSAAIEAAKDSGVVIIGRTDAINAGVYDAAIERAHEFARLGSELVWVDGFRSAEEIERGARDLAGLPLMFDAFEAWPWALRPAAELGELGFHFIIHPLTLTFAYGAAVRSSLRVLKEQGSSRSIVPDLMDRHEYETLLGFAD
jgi:2-methylisocitrate lyase-like PEP mutase family enzyme